MSRAQTMSNGYPIRYVVTIVGKRDGLRTLFDAMQGRYTYATPEEAQARLEVFRANSAQTITECKGDPSTMEVRPVRCYPVHYDPMTYYFD